MTSGLALKGTHCTQDDIMSQCLPIFVGEPKAHSRARNVLNPLGRSDMHL
jgi:hypothetical protein